MGVKNKVCMALLLALLSLAGNARATTFLHFQSTYLGDGWFQYKMNALKDPFFTESSITELVIVFTNQINSVNPENWTNSYEGASYSDWSYSANPYLVPPYEVTFLMHSSENTYKLTTNNLSSLGAIVVSSLTLAELNPFYGSESVFGISYVPCLIPCSPDEADNSPTNFVYDLKLIPDVTINQLIQTNGQIYGVDFTWDYESTFVLQGSGDMNNWTNIAYIWNYPPETVWTTNRALNGFGNSFRVAMVANGYSTNLPPLNSNLVLVPKTLAKASVVQTIPSITGCQPVKSKILVSITTQPNQSYKVQAMDSHGIVRQTQQIKSQGVSANVNFDSINLPNPVFFQVAVVK